MNRIARFTVAAILLGLPVILTAADFTLGAAQVWQKEYPFDANGSLWVENPNGAVEVIGADQNVISISAEKITRGLDEASVEEGREQTALYVAGDSRNRSVRTVVPSIRSGRWSSAVNYVLRVPRGATVKIDSGSADRIRVTNLTGGVSVRNINGPILLEGDSGPVSVDSVNGTIVYTPSGAPSADVKLSTINGHIQIYVEPEARFQWVAEALKGDLLTNLPMHGRLAGSGYRGVLNGGGPTLTTATAMGNVFLIRKGARITDARSVRALESGGPPAAALLSRDIYIPNVDGNFEYQTNIGNIRVPEVHGDARVETAAGEVHLGRIFGSATVRSGGGPLELGDIFGVISAYTKAGDILVQAARAGGEVSTDGGIIRVIYAGGTSRLHSGGGDIIVRQASGPIFADTRSGDVTINVDATLRTTAVNAKTNQGSIVLNVSPKFAADVDITILTSDPDAHTLRTDFPGLQVRRELAGNRTRVRATGKINGGGEKVELYAEEGVILFTANPSRPVRLAQP